MAKNKKDVPSATKINHIIHEIEKDLVNITGFITQEIIKLAEKKGTLPDINKSKVLKKQINSMLNADPEDPKNKGKAVLSLTGTIQGINKKLQKLEAAGVDPKKFAKVKETVKNTKTDFTKKLSSNQGIKNLVSKRYTSQLSSLANNFSDSKNGKKVMWALDNNKQAFINSLESHCEIPLIVSKIMTAKPGRETKNNLIITPIRKKLIQYFSKEGDSFDLKNINKIGATIDHSKTTKENFKKFQSSINTEFKPFAIIQDSLEKKITTPKTDLKITEKLVPALQKLDPEYLKQHGSAISKEITKAISGKKTLLSKFRKRLAISSKNLDKIAKKIVANHLKTSQYFAKSNLSSLSNDGVINKIIQDSINVVTKNGKNINAKTNDNIINGLSSALKDLDPDYLKENHKIISSQLAKNILKKKTFLSKFRKDLNISKKHIDKIGEDIKNNHRENSKNFVKSRKQTNQNIRIFTAELKEKVRKVKTKAVQKSIKKSKTPSSLPSGQKRSTKKQNKSRVI